MTPPAKGALEVQLRRLYRLRRFRRTPGLAVTRALLRALGNPHHRFRSVHITGTTGKGSTASFLARALHAGGTRVGLFTSPHLVRFNERIQVNGRPIPDRALSRLIDEVWTVVRRENLQPAFFEFTTAVAFRYFAEQQVDIAVIEAGMGGLHDPTNVLKPLVSVITNVGIDHTQWLGSTRLAIARNKAGIIKPGTPVVTAERDQELLAYFRRMCARRRAPLTVVQGAVTSQSLEASLGGQTFLVPGRRGEHFRIPLLGAHQVTNACTALAALAALNRRGVRVSASAVRRGFRRTRWPGRLEVVSRRPLTMVDGAHNADGFRALARFLDQLFVAGSQIHHPKVLVIGLKREKDPSALLRLVVPVFDHVIVTEGNFQPQSAGTLRRAIRELYPRMDIRVHGDVGDAFAAARRLAGRRGFVLVAGSLYLVGDVLGLLKRRK